jgi:hypothetical protein
MGVHHVVLTAILGIHDGDASRLERQAPAPLVGKLGVAVRQDNVWRQPLEGFREVGAKATRHHPAGRTLAVAAGATARGCRRRARGRVRSGIRWRSGGAVVGTCVAPLAAAIVTVVGGVACAINIEIPLRQAATIAGGRARRGGRGRARGRGGALGVCGEAAVRRAVAGNVSHDDKMRILGTRRVHARTNNVAHPAIVAQQPEGARAASPAGAADNVSDCVAGGQGAASEDAVRAAIIGDERRIAAVPAGASRILVSTRPHKPL